MLSVTYFVYVRDTVKETVIMSANWDEVRRRQRLLTAALDDVATCGDPGALDRHPIGETFGNLDGFLLAVHARWATAVLARVDAVLEADPVDPARALGAHLRELAGPFAGTRLLLEAHADRPQLAAAVEQLRSRVLVDLGVDVDELAPPGRARRHYSCLRSLLPLLRWSRVSPAG